MRIVAFGLLDGVGSSGSTLGGGDGGDRYIRESMFGGPFGAFRSHGRHFFLEDETVYRELGKIHRLRREQLPLRRGRQFLRQISGNRKYQREPGAAPKRKDARKRKARAFRLARVTGFGLPSVGRTFLSATQRCNHRRVIFSHNPPFLANSSLFA